MTLDSSDGLDGRGSAPCTQNESTTTAESAKGQSETVHHWPTFVLMVLVSGFLIAIAEIIVAGMRQDEAERQQRVHPENALRPPHAGGAK
jgi:hypothetical protein